ncbi:MAG TPA: alpha/beta hydrolase [Dehalococcoidia bacterium]|nr:alpha/beta hydrolase [Dehalococcoidia bacterium]
MPLDPQARAVLDQMAALGDPPLGTATVEETRRNMAARRAGMPPGEPVAKTEDRSVPGPAGSVPVRIYTPEGRAPFPVLVYFHGGGWVIGDIESHDASVRALTNRSGCVIVSVDYRLAPEHKFPAAADDCFAATQWAAAHAAEFGGDASRLAVGGDSAGGNLAAVVALMAKERGGPRIAFQLLIYPVTDHNYETASYSENAEGYLLSRDSMVWFWNHYLNTPAEGKNPIASPLQAADLAGLPPALVITAEFDPLRDEGEAYAKRLKAAGVRVTATRYDGMIHGFFGMFLQIDKAKLALDEAAAALCAALSAAPATARV